MFSNALMSSSARGSVGRVAAHAVMPAKDVKIGPVGSRLAAASFTTPGGESQNRLPAQGAGQRKALTVASDTPLLKSAMTINDAKSLQSARSRFPAAQSMADSFLSQMWHQRDNQSGVSPGDTQSFSECATDNKTGSTHILSATMTATAAAQPVWKIHATDKAPILPPFTVTGEYYCIAPSGDAQREVMDAVKGAGDIDVLRQCAAHDAELASRT